jgi:hypothetical protein
MGEPGWPELAACTASMHSVRIVLMASFSMAALSLATVKPVFMDNLLCHVTLVEQAVKWPTSFSILLALRQARPVRSCCGSWVVSPLSAAEPLPGKAASEVHVLM